LSLDITDQKEQLEIASLEEPWLSQWLSSKSSQFDSK
jgi:hypothetical protein